MADTGNPWSALIAALITNVVVPEVIGLIRAHQQSGQPITEQELEALLLERTARSIAVGEAFLAAHGYQAPPGA